MNIRLKAIVALVVTLASLVGVLYALLGSLLGSGFGAVEARDARRNVERLREAVRNETTGLCQKVNDWAYWDDAYAYAAKPNDEFVKANIAASTFEGMQLDSILIFGASGELLIGASYDTVSGTLGSVPESFVRAHFGTGSPLLKHEAEGSVHSGFALAPGEPAVLVCSMPILSTEGKGPARGSIVFGRNAGTRFQALLSKITRLDVRLAVEGEPAFDKEFAAVLPRLIGPEPADVEVVSEESLVGSTRFEALDGQRSLLLRATLPREVHLEAKRTIAYVLVALMVTGLGFAVVIVLILEVMVLGRVSRLAGEVSHMTEVFDFSGRVQEEGSDEIGRLGRAVNGLLAAVEQVTWASGDAEARCIALNAQLPVALLSLELLEAQDATTPAGLQLLEASAAASCLLHLPPDAPGKGLRTLLPGGDRAWVEAATRALRGEGTQAFELELPGGGRHTATAARIGERRVLVHVGVRGAEGR